MSRVKSLYALIEQVRVAADLVSGIAERTHAGAGVTGAMRAVLERLARAGAQTVPEIARARNVSRQHVQKGVDALAGAGLVAFRPNPAHRRSSLVAPTERGRAVFAGIEAHEAAIVRRLAEQLGDRDLGQTARALRALNEALAGIAEDFRY